MAVNLSTGIIADIFKGAQPTTITLQILAARKFPKGDRYRLLVSDGVHSSGFALLASQLNHMVLSGEVAAHTVVHITRYFCNELADQKKMMVILEMKVVLSAEDVGGIIGEPVTFEKSAAAETTGSKPAAASPAPPGRSPLAQRNPAVASGGARPSYGGGGGGGGGGGSATQAPPGMAAVRPISSLTPYQNKWTICARVTSKTSVRTWSNARGEGKLFSMDLLDESGEIRATAFGAECDRFYDMMEANNVYFISLGNLKTANKQYTSLKNDYEMTFNAGTTVASCHEDSTIPAMQFNFVALDQLENIPKDSIIDLVAVVRETNELGSVTVRSTGKELKKRELSLIDASMRSVQLTLWGTQAENFDGSAHPVLAIKGVRVSDFGGVSLSLINSSTMQVNPDISEAHQLKGWWEQTGSTATTDVVSLSSSRSSGGGMGNVFKCILETKREGLGSRDTADFYSCRAIVALIRKENLLYTACPGDSCNKKVVDMSNGMFRCEKCNKEYDSYIWRLMLSVNVVDFSGSQWITLFQEQAELLLGTTAQELGILKTDDNDRFLALISDATFNEYYFRLRCKMETFNDVSRLKTTAAQVIAVNPVENNRRLIKEIKELAGLA